MWFITLEITKFKLSLIKIYQVPGFDGVCFCSVVSLLYNMIEFKIMSHRVIIRFVNLKRRKKDQDLGA